MATVARRYRPYIRVQHWAMRAKFCPVTFEWPNWFLWNLHQYNRVECGQKSHTYIELAVPVQTNGALFGSTVNAGCSEKAINLPRIPWRKILSWPHLMPTCRRVEKPQTYPPNWCNLEGLMLMVGGLFQAVRVHHPVSLLKAPAAIPLQESRQQRKLLHPYYSRCGDNSWHPSAGSHKLGVSSTRPWG